MSIETFEKASTILWDKLKEGGHSGIMKYKPFSDQYWVEKHKIVICNYENLGYADIQCNSIDHDGFRGWITYKKSKTAHFTAVFANALKVLLEGQDFSIKDMQKSYWEIDKIWSSIKNMVYMNIRPTSGANSGRQNKKETHKLIQNYKNEIKNYIDSLDADILVISSKDSVGLFNYLYDSSELTFEGKAKINNMSVYSVRHFGWFFKYSYYYKKVQEIFIDLVQR